ncbi:PepSY domain-containing protein [Methylovulum psychrotolerans]|nr:PepSY domain-containing protein [Methylovulum psychrotolerans]MBT9099927.1 PepSY domain-containing protein [Methylovulum psychrotolerans]POZ53091.1 hypothetical protein AADEFJLK_00101 [Methylovulum psychrotolerans]
MKKLTPKTVLALVMTGLIAAAGVTVSQADDDKGEAAKKLQLFSQAKISLTEAIKIAEQKIGGKALEAELEDKASTVQFEVEVVKDGILHEAMIDAKTGQVLKVALEDDDDDKDEKSGHDKE